MDNTDLFDCQMILRRVGWNEARVDSDGLVENSPHEEVDTHEEHVELCHCKPCVGQNL